MWQQPVRLAGLKRAEKVVEEEWLDGFLGVEREGDASEDNSSWMAACLGWPGGSSLRRLSREARRRSTFWDDSCMRV